MHQVALKAANGTATSADFGSLSGSLEWRMDMIHGVMRTDDFDAGACPRLWEEPELAAMCSNLQTEPQMVGPQSSDLSLTSEGEGMG